MSYTDTGRRTILYLSLEKKLSKKVVEQQLLKKIFVLKSVRIIPYHKGEAFSFCSLSRMLAAGFWYMAFIMLRYAPSTYTLLGVLIINQ